MTADRPVPGRDQDATEWLEDRRQENAHQIDRRNRLQHWVLLGAALTLGVGTGAAALVMRAPVMLIGPVLMLAGAYAFRRAERARVDAIGPEHLGSYGREFGWTALGGVLLFGGLAATVKLADTLG
ncbi:hypothetical protein [Nocardioides limicola]|uniref:hypothetical protein n=1 Tax=Nocardioides limicola TaxID=2803368 RepID=UPI00193C566B|nr:hypothetical protein [Nocardioides sp. DJM-14]